MAADTVQQQPFIEMVVQHPGADVAHRDEQVVGDRLSHAVGRLVAHRDDEVVHGRPGWIGSVVESAIRPGQICEGGEFGEWVSKHRRI